MTLNSSSDFLTLLFRTRVRCCLQNKRKLPMALIESSARTRPTERARVCHGARTFSWPRDARATSLRALTRAVTLDQRHAPHSLLSRSPQPAPIAKLSLCENTGGTRYAGSRKERGEALRDSRAFCESWCRTICSYALLPKAKGAAPKISPLAGARFFKGAARRYFRATDRPAAEST